MFSVAQFVASRLLLLTFALATLGLQAQEFPSKPVRLIVPSAAGGSTDTITRILAQKLATTLGQPFIVENKAGAGGNIGTDLVAKSKADGYTLLIAAGSTAVNATLYTRLPFDTLKDFDAVALICTVTGILVTNPTVGAANVSDLISLARAQPGKINFASAGSGTVTHLSGEMFKSLATVELTHVPYKGSGPALVDLLGGQVQVMFANMPGTIQHVKSGRLHLLAVTGEKRSTSLPDVPTIAEAGLPGYRSGSWFGVIAPAGTPKNVIAKLNAEIVRALAAPEIAEHLRAEGAEAGTLTAEQFGAFFKADIERWAPLVRASGAKVD